MGYRFVKERLNNVHDMYRYEVVKKPDTIGYMKCVTCDTDIIFGIDGFADLIDRALKNEIPECPECHDNFSFIMDMTLDNLAEAIQYREEQINKNALKCKKG